MQFVQREVRERNMVAIWCCAMVGIFWQIQAHIPTTEATGVVLGEEGHPTLDPCIDTCTN